MTQTSLPSPYEVWTNDFADVVCEECAVKFATENGLVWRGNTSADSFTEDSEELGVGVSCIASYALGDSDYPYSCCGVYLNTNLTEHGQSYLRENFPEWVVALYTGE